MFDPDGECNFFAQDRPFKCIMNGCNMSFNTREALQRHVYRHLEPNVATSPSAAGSSAANSPLRKNQAKNRRSESSRDGSGLSVDACWGGVQTHGLLHSRPVLYQLTYHVYVLS